MKVTMANFPNTIQIGDVREVKASLFSDTPITLMMGGSPCQSFSFAGKRKGMSTKDNIEILSLDQYLELKQNNFEFEGQSYLFWEYVRMLNEVKPKYFLLENVMMEERWEKVITKTIGVHPLDMNSSLVSAQNRRRLYWTNIGLKPQGLFGDLEQTIGQPKDLGILLKDVLEDNPNAKHYLSVKRTQSIIDEKYFLSEKRIKLLKNVKYGCTNTISDLNGKSICLSASMGMGGGYEPKIIIDEKYYLSEKFSNWLQKHSKKLGSPIKKTEGDRKSSTLTSSGLQKTHLQSDFIICHSTQKRSEDRPSVKDNKNAGGSGQLSRDDGKTYCLDRANSMAIEVRKVIQLNESKESHNQQPFQQNRIYDINGISPALQAQLPKGSTMINTSRIRRLTPVECERLQTVPDDYTNYVSDSQRYKMLGNGWTIDVIAFILKHMK